MRDFFGVDGPLYRFLTKFYDILKLNFMWLIFGGVAEFAACSVLCDYYRISPGSYLYLICFIPLVLIGPATAAAFTITLRMVDEKEGYIGKPFLQAYKDNFGKGMILGLVTLVAVFAIMIDFWVYTQTDQFAFMILGIVATIFILSHLLFAYPLQARYENTIVNTLRNSHAISFRYFKRSLPMLLILIALVVVFLWNFVTIFLGILIGPCTLFYMISSTSMYVFRQIERENNNMEQERASGETSEREALEKEI